MKLYDIDYKRLVMLLLPVSLRLKQMNALLSVLIYPITDLWYTFKKNRTKNLIKIKRNGQVCYLRGLLNDELDPDLRRIRIEDATLGTPWRYALAEGLSTQFYASDSTFIYSHDAIIEQESYFIVFVPSALDSVDIYNRLRSYLNEYKLVSKHYIIRYE